MAYKQKDFVELENIQSHKGQQRGFGNGNHHQHRHQPTTTFSGNMNSIGEEMLPSSSPICSCYKPSCKTCCKPVESRCCELRVNVSTYCPCRVCVKPCALLVEFLGTAILIFAIVMSALVDGSELIVISLVAGFTLFMIASIFGAVSGGHFNPAITLVAWLNGDINLIAGLLYVLAQHVGAIVGALLAWIFFDAATGLGTPDAVAPFTRGEAFAAEVIGTAILALAVLFGQRFSTNVALTVGYTLALLHFIFVPISGASLNWVRFFGPAVISGLWGPWYVYLFAPFVGAVIGFALFYFCKWLKCINKL